MEVANDVRGTGDPGALMLAEAGIAEVGEAKLALLRDLAAPVVLLAGRRALPAGVAPGLATLGVMLPATPLHHLRLGAFGGSLLISSGNLSGELQVIGNDEARAKRSAFADAFLMHDRGIARRLDDGEELASAVVAPSGRS